MAKRITIGQVCNPKDKTKRRYIQISKNLKEPVVLKPGQYINLESKADQLAGLKAALAAGKISPENAEKAQARIEKIADWVVAELVMISD